MIAHRIPGLVKSWTALPHQLTPGAIVPEDFFGINVAAYDAPEGDDMVIDYLNRLGIEQVRIDLSAARLDSPQERLLRRLAAEGKRICLRLLQLPAEVGDLPAWEGFLRELIRRDAFNQVDLIEIGSCPNRKKWSGYRYKSYFAAWAKATEILGPLGIALAGPNVSDFEPLHSAFLLDGMKRNGGLPSVHTDNLFAERTRTPEAFDLRVLGKRLSPGLQLNLVKKIRVLEQLNDHFDIDRFMITHTCWHGFRLKHWTENPEQARASLLQRFVLLTAASGACDRLYWGPLIGFSEGLVDDGIGSRNDEEWVASYLRQPGEPSESVPRPAFDAYAGLIQDLRASVCSFVDDRNPESFQLEFRNHEGTTSFSWDPRSVDAKIHRTFEGA